MLNITGNTGNGFFHIITVALLIGCSAFTCQKSNSETGTFAAGFDLDVEQAESNLRLLTAEVHPFGSERQKEISSFLVSKAEAAGGHVTRQEFTVPTPNPDALEDSSGPRPLTLDKTGYNIIASLETGQSDCWVAMGSHYDTKEVPGIDYLGANDSGSSTVALLQILAYFANHNFKPACHLMFIWFDGEEAVLNGWTDGESIHPAKIQDNTYGSRYFVDQLENCEDQLCYENKPILGLVLLDMIGSKELRISQDSHSSTKLLKLLQVAADELDHAENLATRRKSISDDHIPFLEAGISAINIIDFENLDFWHRSGDELEQISTESIEIASKIAILVAIRTPAAVKE